MYKIFRPDMMPGINFFLFHYVIKKPYILKMNMTVTLQLFKKTAYI